MTENQDPELLDDPQEGIGVELDLTAVSETPFDPDQFELPSDFEYLGDDVD